jgi:hypothetical protein
MIQTESQGRREIEKGRLDLIIGRERDKRELRADGAGCARARPAAPALEFSETKEP